MEIKEEHLGGTPLDILGFDSCAMNLVETTYELRETADIIVSPQDFTPDGGWDYEQMLRTFAHKPDLIL